MERQKIHREYLLNATSKSILWSAISTPTGLEGWFADRVQSDDKVVTFFWGKTEHRDAEIIAVRAFSFIRFRWLDDEWTVVTEDGSLSAHYENTILVGEDGPEILSLLPSDEEKA